ncbi:MAG TPA: Asp-tRNA(Asn)/Glu-tRNA(Gln) amidotransferase subunit GatC [Gammaproteobacteria bacterium]|nr:Asp-tRNA(Asn)/Glu-tRNA(Gln) amidotransferase subunit GatC [Gammaproteobacteria bacterium]
MSLDKSDIEKIAWLARLSISVEEIPKYSKELNNILDLVEQMNGVDTANIEPMAHPLEITARLREDRVTESNQRERFQAIAPAVENGHYLVPRVIE